MKRALAPLAMIAGASVAACSTAQEDDAEAASACPVEIDRVAAWFNKMPGPDATTRFHVVVDFTSEEASFQLVEAEGGDATRTFDLAPLADAPPSEPGESGARFSERLAGPEPERVVIRCGGAVVAEIDEIESVY
ncbi:MAG: hypothetical protein AAGC56_08020 [Pseudomonadota bacterium]